MSALREHHRFGCSGKSARILDLIDHYWDLIEGDFAKHLHGVDARDWVRGERPWAQFLNYCDVIAQEEGGRFWAAQLSDPRYEADIERKLAEMEAAASGGRPPLAGHTAVVRALYMVANQTRLLIRAMGSLEIGFIDGPEGPADRIASRRKSLSDALVDAATGMRGGE